MSGRKLPEKMTPDLFQLIINAAFYRLKLVFLYIEHSMELKWWYDKLYLVVEEKRGRSSFTIHKLYLVVEEKRGRSSFTIHKLAVCDKHIFRRTN